jgi:hypothetical protein
MGAVSARRTWHTDARSPSGPWRARQCVAEMPRRFATDNQARAAEVLPEVMSPPSPHTRPPCTRPPMHPPADPMRRTNRNAMNPPLRDLAWSSGAAGRGMGACNEVLRMFYVGWLRRVRVEGHSGRVGGRCRRCTLGAASHRHETPDPFGEVRSRLRGTGGYPGRRIVNRAVRLGRRTVGSRQRPGSVIARARAREYKGASPLGAAARRL